MEKQNKIAKTYRLTPITIKKIQFIKDSFSKDDIEISSDAGVIQYAIGLAAARCKDVDDGYQHISLDKNSIQRLIMWYGNLAADGLATDQDEKIAQLLLDSIQ